MRKSAVVRAMLAALVVAGVGLWFSPAPDPSFTAGMRPVAMEGSRVLSVAPVEVTWDSWNACYGAGACSFLPRKPAGGAKLPVTGVNWFDVKEYLAWANGRAGGGLRLPTLEEWRILNRSLEAAKPPPLFTDPRLAWAADYGREKTTRGPVRPGGSFSTTPDGISDLDGNVWEWTSTCAKPAVAGTDDSRCPAFIAAGDHEATISVFVRDPASGGCATGTPPTHIGLRLVTDRKL